MRNSHKNELSEITKNLQSNPMDKMKSKKWLIIAGITIALIMAFIFLIRPLLSSICAKYNTPGVRSGSCEESAPFFCRTVYYPPACDICQDAQGCGF